MAKKNNYKNIKINEENLAVTTIGEMPNDQKGPIFVIIFFALLLGIVFFLPDIMAYFNKNDAVIVDGNNKRPSGTSNIDEKEELILYELTNDLKITLDEVLVIDNFKVNTDTINFRIKNNGETRYYFNRYNYFMELYSIDNTLLERVILQKEGITRESSKDYTYEIKPETANLVKKITFVDIPLEGYPLVTLTNQSITCTKKFQTITYAFENDKLMSINDIINYPYSNDITYQNNLLTYQSQVSFNNNIPGVNANITETSTGFIVNTMLDLKNADVSKLTSQNYYAKDTDAKIIMFEMAARGFSCN